MTELIENVAGATRTAQFLGKNTTTNLWRIVQHSNSSLRFSMRRKFHEHTLALWRMCTLYGFAGKDMHRNAAVLGDLWRRRIDSLSKRNNEDCQRFFTASGTHTYSRWRVREDNGVIETIEKLLRVVKTIRYFSRWHFVIVLCSRHEYYKCDCHLQGQWGQTEQSQWRWDSNSQDGESESSTDNGRHSSNRTILFVVVALRSEGFFNVSSEDELNNGETSAHAWVVRTRYVCEIGF